MIKSASLSSCGQYRYRLARHWDADTPPLTFVMLNPSTADAQLDDPTLRRCIGFAKRERAGGVVVVNLYAYRATHPGLLRLVGDPCGPCNADALRDAIRAANGSEVPVVCAWGTKGTLHDGARSFLDLAARERCRLLTLGMNKSGHPRHPLYARADQPLNPLASQVEEE